MLWWKSCCKQLNFTLCLKTCFHKLFLFQACFGLVVRIFELLPPLFLLLSYVKDVKQSSPPTATQKHIHHVINSKAESVPAGTFLPSQPKPLKVVAIMIILLEKARGIFPANLFVSVLANAPSRLINSLTELFQTNKICISHLLNFPAATDNFLINKHSFCQDTNPVQLAGIKRRARNKSRKYRLQSPESAL